MPLKQSSLSSNNVKFFMTTKSGNSDVITKLNSETLHWKTSMVAGKEIMSFILVIYDPESLVARNRLSFQPPFPPPPKSPGKNTQEVANSRPQPREKPGSFPFASCFPEKSLVPSELLLNILLLASSGCQKAAKHTTVHRLCIFEKAVKFIWMYMNPANGCCETFVVADAVEAVSTADRYTITYKRFRRKFTYRLPTDTFSYGIPTDTRWLRLWSPLVKPVREAAVSSRSSVLETRKTIQKLEQPDSTFRFTTYLMRRSVGRSYWWCESDDGGVQVEGREAPVVVLIEGANYSELGLIDRSREQRERSTVGGVGFVFGEERRHSVESEMLLKKVDLLGYPLATEAQNPSFNMENISV
ncbi:hypothetical protein LXL04_008710 [Taraxacum kok-saghyz]